MSRWKTNSWSLVVLGCVLCVVLLLLVLPDVDPPDTAFHRDTSPVAVHAQGVNAPTAVAVAPAFRLAHLTALVFPLNEQRSFSVSSTPYFRLILLRSLRW